MIHPVKQTTGQKEKEKKEMSQTATATAIEVIKNLTEEAKKRADARLVTHEHMKVNEYHRQGDIYITKIAELPKGAVSTKLEPQLAPGDSMGSRHCIRKADLHCIKMYTLEKPTALDGPVIESSEAFTIEHPEHGHVTVPAGFYQINYQRQYAEELRRVRD